MGEAAGSERVGPSQTQEDGSSSRALKEDSFRALGGSHENSSRTLEGSSWETFRSTESAPSPAVPPCSLPVALWRWLLSAPAGTVRAGATEHRVEAAGEKSAATKHAMWLRAMLESDGKQPQRHAAWLQEQSELARKVADTEDSAAHTNRPPRAQPPRAPVRTPHPAAPDASSTQACRQHAALRGKEGSHNVLDARTAFLNTALVHGLEYTSSQASTHSTHLVTNSLVAITSGHEAWLSDMHVPAYLVDSETRLAQQAQLERGWTSRPAETPASARKNFESVRSRSRGRALLLDCGLLGRAGSGSGASAGAGAGAGAQSPTSRGDGNGGGEGRARWLACRALLKAEELAHQQMAAAYLQAHTHDLYTRALAHSLPRPRAIRHPRGGIPRSPRTSPPVHNALHGATMYSRAHIRRA